MDKFDDITQALTFDLIRAPSVSPQDCGCQALMAEFLADLGFTIRPMPFADVTNLWAIKDSGIPGPLFVFAGHTDVVPTGPLDEWTSDPFEPRIDGDLVYGRGAADMKGSLAAMMTATQRFLEDNQRWSGKLAFLITSDEEADAINGTVKVMQALTDEDVFIDYCVVGEPSSDATLGDVVRVGRRGSLNATLTVQGVQGHVAYPDKAVNPIHLAMQALADLSMEHWDDGNDYFPPTSMQISNIHSGTGAGNVVPGTLEARFNFRFSTESTAETLQARSEAIFARHNVPCNIDWALSGNPFLTTKTNLINAVQQSIREQQNIDTELSTSGGTSDGRFIAPYGTELVELGPRNATIHQINECTSLPELFALSRLYTQIMTKLLNPST